MGSYWVWFIIEFSANLAEGIFLITFLGAFLQKKSFSKWIYIGLPLFQACSTYVVNQSGMSSVLGMLVCILIGFMIAFFFYMGNPMRQLLLILAYFVVWFISELVVMFSLNFIFEDFLVKQQTQSIERLTSIIVCKTILFIVLRIVITFCPGQEQKISTRRLIPLFSLPVATLGVAFSFLIFWQGQTDTRLFFWSALASVVLLFTNFIVFDQYQRLEKDALTKQQNQLLLQYLDSEKQQIMLMDSQQHEVRRIAHDLKNSLIPVMEALNLDRTEDAKKFVGEILHGTTLTRPDIYTNQSLVDAVISQKVREAESRWIEIHIDASPMVIEYVTPVDVSVILGNTLDNAIEAVCRQEEGTKRMIKLALSQSKGLLYICETNTISEDVVVRQGKIETSKADTTRHGIGLSSVRHIVEKYGGNITFECKDKNFEVRIVLQDQKS